MTRMRLLAAAAAALAVAETASAQMYFAYPDRVGTTGNTSRFSRSMRGSTYARPASSGYYTQPTATYGSGTVYAQPMTATYAVPTTAYSTTPSYGMTTVQPGGYVVGNPSMGVVQTSGVVTGSPYTGTVQAGGYFPTTQGVVSSGGFGVPQQMSGGVVQTGATTASSNQVVTTQVLAPDGATVTLSGTQADRTQGVRTFTSPQLDPNQTYTYRAKATWTENGETKTREKNVDVRAGQQVTIDLTKADTDTQGSAKQPD